MSKNPLSALSYTNKDFQTIYVELLDLVKQLTKKWDPSISNESDPGVILLKLNAIIADKNNYNIDKNILEAFPQTVTQEVNARNLYEQLAYKMPWYQSGVTTVQFRWKGDVLTDGQLVTIPEYTMLTDAETSTVYTTLNKVELYAQHPVSSVQAAEGIITTYVANNSSTVTLANLDNSRRLYLGDYTVAQNHVFIRNTSNSLLWKQVDNLAVEQLGNKFFEFGVDARTSTCFIEFPEDIDQLIGEGLTVKYLVSQGATGNIAAKSLDRLYEEISVNVGNRSVALTSDVLELYNTVPSVGGSDPESITDAFASYKKVAGTFHTLVTLRDYINFIQSSNMVSNGFVCDRTNDVQSCYTVVTDSAASPVQNYVARKEGSTDKICYVKPVNDPYLDGGKYYVSTETGMQRADDVTEENYQDYYVPYVESAEPEMASFDLRMYVLEKPAGIDSIDSYESSFNVVPSESVVCNNLIGYMLDQKCVQHDFRSIIPNVPCMFRNSFPLKIKIVPTKTLTSNEISSVRMNILSNLRKVLNSSKVSFGVAPNYDIIYDAVNSSDERIKTCIVDDFEYTTFAIYWDGNNFIEIPVSSSRLDSVISCYVGGLSPSALKVLYVDEREQKDFFESCYLVCDQKVDSEGEFQSSTPDVVTEGSSTKYHIYKWNRATNTFYEYSDKLTDIRLDVIAKSILAGKTTLYKQDTSFALNINQQYVDDFSTDRITTGLVVAPNNSDITNITEPLRIVVGKTEESDIQVNIPESSGYVGSYTLKKNESVRFLGPLLETENSYTGYVKFEACLLDKGDQLVAMPYDSTKKWLGTAYLSETDYDKVCLKDWKDLYNASIVYYSNSDITDKTGESVDEGTILSSADVLECLNSANSISRSLLLDNNKQNSNYPDRMPAQASLVIPTLSQKYDTKYTIEFKASDIKDKKIFSSTNTAPDLDIIITPFNSSDATGSYTDYKDVVEASSSALYDSSKGVYSIQYVNPQEAGSFSVKFKCKNEEQSDMYVALTDIEVFAWRTDVSAPLKEVYKYYTSCSDPNLGTGTFIQDSNLFTTLEDQAGRDIQYIKIEDGTDTKWYMSVLAPEVSKRDSYFKSRIIPDNNDSLQPLETSFILEMVELSTEDVVFENYPYKYYKYTSDYEPIESYKGFPDNWGYAYHTSYFTGEYEDNINVPVFVPVAHALRYSMPLHHSNIVNCGQFDKYFTSHDATWDWELTEHDDSLYWYCEIDTREGTPYPHIELDMWASGDIQFRFIQDVCEVPPEASYKLRKGEYITFFWREQDADDAPYKYKRLVGLAASEETVDVKSPIIQPNFLLHASSVKEKGTSGNTQYDYSNALVDPTLLQDEGNIMYGTDAYIRISNMYGDNDLSGTKELKIQQLKQITSTPRKDGNYISRYFFITNHRGVANPDGNGDREYCYLRFHRITDEDNEEFARYRYYLGPDETFVYMNDRGTSYTIMGSGTMIGVDFDLTENKDGAKECWSQSSKLEKGVRTEEFEVPPESYWKAVPSCGYSELTTKGLEILDTESLTVDTSEMFIVGEQQLFTVVEGDTLRIYKRAEVKKTSEPLKQSPYSYIDDYGRKCPTYSPIFTSFANTYVDSNYEVSYTTGTTTIDLPKIDIDDNGDARWVGRAALNLSSSAVDPQSISSITPSEEHVLNEGVALQYIINSNSVYPQVFEQSGVELSPQTSSTVRVETDTVQDKVGGTNIDVSYLSWSGDKKETHFYIYIDNPEYRKDGMSVDSKHNVNLHLDKLLKDSTEIEIPLKVTLQPSSSYIVQIRNTSRNCSVEFTGTAQLQQLSTKGTFNNIDKYGTYYAMLTTSENSETTELRLILRNLNSAKLSDTDVLIIAPFYKKKERDPWKTFSSLYGISDEDILKRIEELDYNDIFKYNYVVPEEVEIEDPVEAATFFNDNHIFREFTIPKAECRISSASGSKIQIVNNR